MILWIVGAILGIAVIVVIVSMVLSIKRKVDYADSNKLPEIEDPNKKEEVEVMQGMMEDDMDYFVEEFEEQEASTEEAATNSIVNNESRESQLIEVTKNKAKLPSLNETNKDSFEDLCGSLDVEELDKELDY